MSTPRPAMFVATVTVCGRPACVTMSASFSCCFAFSTECGTPRFSSNRDSFSDFSTEIVPLFDVVGDGIEFGILGLVDEVGVVVPDHGLVGRDPHDLERVRVREL